MCTGLTPAEASLRGRLGAHALHAKRNATETTAKARAAFLARFENEVDPDRALPEGERRRRAKHALKAHMARLSLESARARRETAEAALEAEYARL